MRHSSLLLAIATMMSLASSAVSYPTGYDQLYLMLSWSNDARSMALGDGIVCVPDGFHNDALLNPSFAGITDGWYFSANTHLTLIAHEDGAFFTSSMRSSGYGANLPLERGQFQKFQIGAAISHFIHAQFSLVRNDVREVDTIWGSEPWNPFLTEEVKSELFALTVSIRPYHFCAVGITGKYFESRYHFDDKVYHYKGSRNGTSYDVGASLLNLFPKSTYKLKLSEKSHFYSKFRDTVHAGINCSISLRDFGPRSKYPVALGPYHDLPTTFKASISYVPVKSDQITVELFAGFAQNFKGTYQEDFWEFQYADVSDAVEVTLVNLVRLRLSTFQSDLNDCNAWGLSVGPNWCQLEYAQIKDLGIITDNFTSGNDGRRVLSLTINHRFK
jgi:hypothetical protein